MDNSTIIFNHKNIINDLKNNFRNIQMDYLNTIKRNPNKIMEMFIIFELLEFYTKSHE